MNLHHIVISWDIIQEHPFIFLFTIVQFALGVWVSLWCGKKFCLRYYTTRKYHFHRTDKHWCSLHARIVIAYSHPLHDPEFNGNYWLHAMWHKDADGVLDALEYTGYGVVITKRSTFPVGSKRDIDIVAPHLKSELTFAVKHRGAKLSPEYISFLERELGYNTSINKF